MQLPAEQGSKLKDYDLKLGITLMAGVGGWNICFAQVSALDPMIGQLIANFGIMGVLVWHLWYHTTKSYPQMLEKFSVEQEKTRVAFLEEQEKSRASFLVEQREQRADHQREQDELRAMLIQNLQAMRVAVHDVKDAAQAVISKQAVEQHLAKGNLNKGRTEP